MSSRPLFIGSEIYRRSSYGSRHPLAIPRVSTVIDLCRALGWLPDAAYLDSPRAAPAELARFHDPVYIAALAAAEREQRVTDDVGRRHSLGRHGNPIYPEMFRRPATACGAGLLAARLLLAGDAAAIYSPAGGTHHGQPDRAAGFCYFNDPALAILALLDGGLARVAYVDLDAHHGDGVEDAFAEEPRVLTISVHEAGRWPLRRDTVQRQSETVRNLAVPAGFSDAELAFVADRVILPLVIAFAPEALVVQCGADALDDDPLSRLALTNNGLADAVDRLRPLAPRLLLLGGGGYNPWSVARCWTRNWALLAGRELPERLPPAAEDILRRLSWSRRGGRNPPEHWFTTLADPARPAPVRDEIRRIVDDALAAGAGRR